MSRRKHKPVHPGEVLKRDFMEAFGVTADRLAKETGITARQLGQIVAGTRSVSAEVALRLARFFGNSAEVWMGLQARYDLDKAENKSGRRISARVKPLKDREALLEAIEDREDLKAARRAIADMKRKGEKPIPWSQAEAELGL